MTNAAFASLRQVANELLQHDENLTSSEFCRICSSFRSSFEVELRSQKIIGTNTSLLSRLQHIERTLSDCQKDKNLFSHDPSCARCGHSFAAQVHSMVIKGTGGNRFISSAMIENIIHWVSGEVIPLNAIMRSTPVYSDVAEDLMADAKNDKVSWSAVLGLNLLSQSYRVYLRYVKQPNLIPKSRIIALKLAQQVCSQITTILQDQTCFPCRCSQTLGWHLQSMALDLQCYARHNCWDLVFQSPWVAGNHVLEILDLCNYYGHYLLKYRHYVGAILHSYNALTHLGGLDKVPMLDKLCSQYRETLFPGGNLPKSNFHACWARYVGARLKFRKNHKGKNTHDNWCLSIPAHAAKMAAGIGIPDHRRKDKVGCLLFNIKQQDYHISDAQWGELNDSYAKVQRMRKNKSRETSDMKVPTSSAQMEKQRLLPLAMTTQALLAGSSKTLPMARVNLFAVFERSVRVVSTISDKMHQEEHLGKGDYCICFANELLNAADRIVKGRRFGKLAAWKEPERKLVSDTKDAILAAFGDVNEEELLWDV
jgi:predicted Zn-ribbon and HTH transcriptional regulator